MTDRLAWPLALRPDGTFATVVQDDDPDLQQCIRAITRTRTGERPDLPDMGVADPTHGEQPLAADAQELEEIVARYEPRVSGMAATNPALLDGLLDEALITYGYQPTTPQED